MEMKRNETIFDELVQDVVGHSINSNNVQRQDTKLEILLSEVRKEIILNRFSGTVNPVDGDFSGVVNGGLLC
jgi:hypothetical protein